MDEPLGYQAPSTAFLTRGGAQLELGGSKQALALSSPYELLPQALYLCVEAQIDFCPQTRVVLKDEGRQALEGWVGESGDLSRIALRARGPREYVHRGARVHWSGAAPFSLDQEELGVHAFDTLPQGAVLSRYAGAYPCSGFWGDGSILFAKQKVVYVKEYQGGLWVDYGDDPRAQTPSLRASIESGAFCAYLSWCGFLFSYRSRSARPGILDHQLWVQFIPG